MGKFLEMMKKQKKFEQLAGTIKSIEDINDRYDYVDEHPNGRGDNPTVSCGQKNDYNELEYIYDNQLLEHIESGAITEEQAVEALFSACFFLDNPRARKDFYKHLTKVLGVEIS
jgi:hypothetical protein